MAKRDAHQPGIIRGIESDNARAMMVSDDPQFIDPRIITLIGHPDNLESMVVGNISVTDADIQDVLVVDTQDSRKRLSSPIILPEKDIPHYASLSDYINKQTKRAASLLSDLRGRHYRDFLIYDSRLRSEFRSPRQLGLSCAGVVSELNPIELQFNYFIRHTITNFVHRLFSHRFTPADAPDRYVTTALYFRSDFPQEKISRLLERCNELYTLYPEQSE